MNYMTAYDSFVLVKCLYSYDCLCLFKSLYCTCIVSEFTLCMLYMYNKSLIECLINSQTPKYLFSWMINLLRCQWAMTPLPRQTKSPPTPRNNSESVHAIMCRIFIHLINELCLHQIHYITSHVDPFLSSSICTVCTCKCMSCNFQGNFFFI